MSGSEGKTHQGRGQLVVSRQLLVTISMKRVRESLGTVYPASPVGWGSRGLCIQECLSGWMIVAQ